MDLILTGKEGIFVAAKQGDAVTLKQAPDASCSIATAVPKAVGHFIECEKLRRFVHCRFVQVFFCELATGPRARPDPVPFAAPGSPWRLRRKAHECHWVSTPGKDKTKLGSRRRLW